MDNQFINAPLLVNRSSPPTDHKDQLIRKLSTKNSKLKSQLLKIQKAIEEKFGNQDEEILPKKRQSIFQHQENYQVLTKELANTYKRIKMYEYQIGKLQQGNRSINISQKSSQVQTVIKQKKHMSDKLKLQLNKQQKRVQDNMKKLQKNNQKDQLQQHMRKLAEQAKYYKQKIKVLEQKEAIKTNNMKKQFEAIKKYQTQLLQNGVAVGELQQIKRSAINSLKASHITRKTMQQSKIKDDGIISGSDQQIQDKTRQHYNALLSEIALLEKMQNDYQKQMIKSFDQKIQSVNKNMDSRNRLIQCENEIENMQKEIQVIKSKVVPSNLKPNKPLRSLSSHQGQNPNKLMPAKPVRTTMMIKQRNSPSFTRRQQQLQSLHEM